MGTRRHRLGRFELLTAERVVLRDGAPVPLRRACRSRWRSTWPANGRTAHASRYDLYGIALLNLVEALLFAGEPDEAERTARQLLAGRPQFLVGLTLCLALLAAERGRFEDAAKLLGHGRRVYADNALPLEPAELKVTERVQGLLRAALSAGEFGRLTTEGARLDEPAAFALSGVG